MSTPLSGLGRISDDSPQLEEFHFKMVYVGA
jgi:hypothetical protein